MLTMVFAIGHISGCHLNPAISVGLWVGGRFPASKVLPYIVAQVLGAVVAGGVLYVIASGAAGFDDSGQPLYGPRDEVDLGKLRELGKPFWLAGSRGRPGALAAPKPDRQRRHAAGHYSP